MHFLYIAILLFVTAVECNNDNNNWPQYLLRCDRNTPNLSQCLVVHANRAIDKVLRGDYTVGFRQLKEIKDVTLGHGQTWKIQFDTAELSGIEHLSIGEMNWNFKDKTVFILFNFNSAVYGSGNYVSSGIYGNMDISGKGWMDMIIIGGTYGGNITYSMKYDLINVLNKDYIQIRESKCTEVEGLRLSFNNILKTKEEAQAMLNYVNENIDIGKKTILIEFSKYFCKFVNRFLNPIFYNFPINIIFP